MMNDSSKTLPVGAVLNSGSNTYTVVKVLGQGGFGITYLATGNVTYGNIKLKAQFAIKEHFIDRYCERNGATHAVAYSRPVADEVEESRKDFLSEARRLRDLSNSPNRHPNIVCVNETFEANNTAYFVMEYLDGESLSSYVKRYGTLSDKEMRQVMEPIIGAVAFLHKERITHLDIKPANIMLAQDDAGNLRPVLIDFGLSRHFNPETGEPSSVIQQAGFSAGYAPIEQVEAFSNFYPATDVYALGATMLYALTGTTPVAAANLDDETLRNSIPAGLPESTVAAITAAMHHFRKDRPENAGALLSILKDQIIPDVYVDPKEILKKAPKPAFTPTPKPAQASTPKPTPKAESKPAPAPQPAPKPVFQSVPPKKSGKGLFVGIVIGILVMLVALGVVWFTKGFGLIDKQEKAADKVEATASAQTVDVEQIVPEETTVGNQAIPVEDALLLPSDSLVEQSDEESEESLPVEEETVAVKPRKTANHLDLAVEYYDKGGYFSADEWTSLPAAEQDKYRKVGMVVSTKGERFIVRLNDKENGREMSWNDAIYKYRYDMPSYGQGEALASLGWDTWKAMMNAYGGDATDYFWTREDYSSTYAWVIRINSRQPDTYIKTEYRKVRLVIAMP